MEKNKKVVIGMSGGVDSSVAAYLLKEAGYDVIGITMRLWEDEEDEYFDKYGGCCSLSTINDARRVCDKLDIPFYVVNFKDLFKETVVENFLDEYVRGRTPNPCIMCNKYLKFDALLKKAHELGAYYVATGHYAKVVYDEMRGRFLIKKAESDRKDQTYALYHFTQDQLRHTLMPLGEMESKEKVREIAAKLDVYVSEKPDSQEICFVPDDDYAKFVSKYRPGSVRKGKFIDSSGNFLGKHEGITNFTIGQRKGLGITFGKPTYVTDIDPNTHSVTLGPNEEVYSDGLVGRDANFISFDNLEGEVEAQIKVRYSARPAACTIRPGENGEVVVMFKEPQRAVTPGQAAVFYDGSELMGGVTIDRAIKF